MSEPAQRLNTGANVQVKGKLNVAVSLCGGTQSILESISSQNPGLDAIIIAEAGPNLLIAEHASHLFGTGKRDVPESQQVEFSKEIEDIEDLYRKVRNGMASRKEVRTLEYQLQQAREEAVKAAKALNDARKKRGSQEVKIYFVFDEPRTGKEQYPSRQFQISSIQEARQVAVVAGESREDDLVTIAARLSDGGVTVPPSVLIADFLFGKSGDGYDARPENLKPSIPHGKDLSFKGDTVKRRIVDQNLFSKVNVFIGPAYTFSSSESLDIVKKTHADGYYAIVNAGPCIEEEPSESSRELTNEVYFGSYALLMLDSMDNWVAYKRKLRNARFKIRRKFNDYLERAYKAYDQVETQLHHARINNKKMKRRARIAGVLGLVGVALTAVGFFTSATRLAPKLLDFTGLLGLKDMEVDQGVDGWESKDNDVNNPPITNETKTATVVDDRKVKELEQQLEQYKAKEVEYQKVQEQVAQLQKTLEEKTAGFNSEREDLQGRLATRDKAVSDLQGKISRLSRELESYRLSADSNVAIVEDLKKKIALTEEELKKKEAEIARFQKEGHYITDEEFLKYEQTAVICDDLRQKLREEKENHKAQLDSFNRQHKLLNETYEKLQVVVDAANKKMELMKKNFDERLQELQVRLEQAGDPTAFAEYQKKVVARYEQQISDLKTQHKKELERLAQEKEDDLEAVRREKEQELRDKLAQIVQERESAILVVNKPVEDLGPYLNTGIPQSYVTRFFGSYFESQLSGTYGTSYRLFAVRQGERTFLKIICEDGTTDFRIVPEENTKTFYSQIDMIRTHLREINSALDSHLEAHGSLEITYSGTDIYGDIYKAVFDADPTEGQTEDMRHVVQARVKPYIVENLRRKLKPGKKVTLRLPKSD